MRTILAEYNPRRNSIDVYTCAGYMLRIDCWEAEKNLKTTPGSDCALNTLVIDEPLEYAQLYLDGFSFHLTAPYSEERREAAWEYAREHDAADRLK